MIMLNPYTESFSWHSSLATVFHKYCLLLKAIGCSTPAADTPLPFLDNLDTSYWLEFSANK